MPVDFIPAGILADLQTTVNRSLPDVATDGRTSLSFPCRVTADTRDFHLQGLPSIMRIRRWKIAADHTQDVRLGDILTVTNRGIYRVLELEHPRSYFPAVQAYCLMLADQNGSLPIVTNTQVTFTRVTTGAQVTVGAVVFAVTNTESLMPFAAGYDWGVVFDARTSFGDGSAVDVADTILWAGLQRPVAVSEPHVVPDIPNLIVMFFRESDRGSSR